MPRIRKKTSKRGTTHQRARIQRKATESRKRKKKETRKNPDRKSKRKKDPGIPNNFPYKDQILAEVAEERRRASEEKQRRKEEKQAAASGKPVELQVGSSLEGSTVTPAFDGIVSVNHAVISGAGEAGAVTISSDVSDEEAEDEEEEPVLLHHSHPHLRSVLEHADVVLQVLDARDPLLFRSAHLERLVNARPKLRMLFVLNKIDLCPREAVAAWTIHLRTYYPTLLFRAASLFLPSAAEVVFKPKDNDDKKKLKTDDALGVDPVIECLSQWAREKEGNDPLVVAVVGLVNSGKSALINSLLCKSVLPLYKLSSSPQGPSTTTLPQQVTIDDDDDDDTCCKHIQIIDTPGLSWSREEGGGGNLTADDNNNNNADANAIRARDILLRNKGRIDRLKDSIPTIKYIVSRADPRDLMLLYDLPSFEKNNAEAFLACLARSRRLVMKRGALDLAGAARIVLRDWSIGKFLWYTHPPPTISSPGTTTTSHQQGDEKKEEGKKKEPYLANIYANDERTLSLLPTRKRMRKQGMGIVKFVTTSSSTIDTREIELEAPWVAEDGSDIADDEDEDEDNGGEDDDADDEDEDRDEDDPEEVVDFNAEDEEEWEDEGEDENVVDPASQENGEPEGEEETFPKPPVVMPGKQNKRKRTTVDVPELLVHRPSKKAVVVVVSDSGLQKKSSSSSAVTSSQQELIHPKTTDARRRRHGLPVFTTKTKKTPATNVKVLPAKSSKHDSQDAYDFAQFFGAGKLP